MPPPYGITPTGFNAPTMEEIREEIGAVFRAAWGQSIDLSDGSVEGQLMTVISERVEIVWELAEQIYSGMAPDAATGALLEAICILTGTFRREASKSTVTLTLTGDASTAVGLGSKAKTAVTNIEFATTTAATITALTAWAPTTAYVVGDRRTNASRCYECITAGTSAGSGGPTTTAADITDGTVHWTYLGEGAAAIDVNAECTVTGPNIAVARDITTITTPVSGWSSVINLLDAELGRDLDSDEVLRQRRELDLFRPASGTINGLRAAINSLDDVVSCTVFANNSDEWELDVDGTPIMPPHSVEALVRGGDNVEILEALFNNVAAGILTHGSTSGATLVEGEVEDSEGNPHTIRFTRPEEKDIWLDITLKKDPAIYPADGDAQVKLAIVTWGDTLPTGYDARPTAIAAQCFKVAGVLEVPQVLLEWGEAPTGGDTATIAVGPRQVAVFDTSVITVTSTDDTP